MGSPTRIITQTYFKISRFQQRSWIVEGMGYGQAWSNNAASKNIYRPDEIRVRSWLTFMKFVLGSPPLYLEAVRVVVVAAAEELRTMTNGTRAGETGVSEDLRQGTKFELSRILLLLARSWINEQIGQAPSNPRPTKHAFGSSIRVDPIVLHGASPLASWQGPASPACSLCVANFFFVQQT